MVRRVVLVAPAGGAGRVGAPALLLAGVDRRVVADDDAGHLPGGWFGPVRQRGLAGAGAEVEDRLLGIAEDHRGHVVGLGRRRGHLGRGDDRALVDLTFDRCDARTLETAGITGVGEREADRGPHVVGR